MVQLFKTPSSAFITVCLSREFAMGMSDEQAGCESCYELRFEGFFHAGRSFAFPCDARGNVNLTLLSDRARVNYLRVREMVGRDFFTPMMYRRTVVT
jgi:hypothetical protein